MILGLALVDITGQERLSCFGNVGVSCDKNKTVWILVGLQEFSLSGPLEAIT